MKKFKGRNKFLRRIKLFYLKAAHINDSPQKIALGVAIGVFSGIMPAMGMLAALLLAVIFRANRAAAILGSAITNAWIGFATFLLSIKVGSVILGIDWQDVRRHWDYFIANFRLSSMVNLPISEVLFPLLIGYLAVAALIGLATYILTLILVRLIHAHKNRTKLPG